MTVDQINALTIQNTLYILLDRILDLSVIPDGQPTFMLNVDESMAFYDRVIVNAAIVKPSLSVFNTELDQYKAELIVIENARIAEVARVDGLTNRFNAIPNLGSVFVEAGIEIRNPALELKRIIDENDSSRLTSLEASSAAMIAANLVKEQLEQEMAVADHLVETCLGCIKLVMKHNIKVSLTKEQKDQQASDYSAVFAAIKDWRPGKAKSLISALVPDGTLVTQDLKDELIAFLTSKGI